MQKRGMDYHDVFAPTGMYKTMRLCLSLAALEDYELDQLDVPSAFLNADLEETVYMELPDGFQEGNEGMVCRLNKAIYGLKQASRNWYLEIRGFVQGELKLIAVVSDPCLFVKRSRTGKMMRLFVFVDDFQASYHRDDRVEWQELKMQLVLKYRIKDLGPSRWILGMSITRDRQQRTLHLSQELYITKALEKYGMQDCKPAPTPEITGYDRLTQTSSKIVEPREYQELVGTLLYAAISTRPDIAHAVHELTKQMQSPAEASMTAAKRVLRYLAGTRAWGLQFGGRDTQRDSRSDAISKMSLDAYADADWAGDRADRKSTSGWMVRLNGDVISWASKKQSIVAQSTCEAELYAEAAAINEIQWQRGILKELGFEVGSPSVIYGDNQSTVTVSNNGVKSERTKHIDVKYHYVTDCIEQGIVRVQWIPTDRQAADVFTKALDVRRFAVHRAALISETKRAGLDDESKPSKCREQLTVPTAENLTSLLPPSAVSIASSAAVHRHPSQQPSRTRAVSN